MAEQNAVELSKTLQKQIADLRKPFTQFAADFGKVYQQRKNLAPSFMACYIAWQGETGITTFVRFVQALDSTVPADRNGYREHPAYQAADYMRRLAQRRDSGGNASRPARSVGVTNLARLLKTVLPLYKDAELFWRGISNELGLKPRQITNLRTAVDEVEPLIVLPKLKALVDAPDIIHMVTPTEQRDQVTASAHLRENAQPMASGTARRSRRESVAA